MADGTKIEWADATLNYLNGCTVLSRGCTNCYAMKLAGTRLRDHPTRQGLTIDTKAGPVWNGDVRPHEPALLQALRWKRGRRIFWNAHGDTFHEGVRDEWIDRLFAICALTPQHTHMILTKRSARMREYCRFRFSEGYGEGGGGRLGNILREVAALGSFDPSKPLHWPLPNVWLGVSVEDQQTADDRIPDLLATPAAVRFISAEPLLGPLDLTDIGSDGTVLDPECWGDCACDSLYGFDAGCRRNGGDGGLTRKIDWVIAGGEHGDRAMHPDWVRSLRDQCAAAGTAFLFKQWGDWQPVCAMTDDEMEACYPPKRDEWDERTRLPRVPSMVHTIDGEQLDLLHPRAFTAGTRSMQTFRVGKKRAGRLLDGRTHDDFPQAALETCP